MLGEFPREKRGGNDSGDNLSIKSQHTSSWDGKEHHEEFNDTMKKNINHCMTAHASLKNCDFSYMLDNFFLSIFYDCKRPIYLSTNMIITKEVTWKYKNTAKQA